MYGFSSYLVVDAIYYWIDRSAKIKTKRDPDFKMIQRQKRGKQFCRNEEKRERQNGRTEQKLIKGRIIFHSVQKISSSDEKNLLIF